MNAPLSIWTQYYKTLGPEEAILALKSDGITHAELSFEHSAMIMARSADHIAGGRKFAEFLKSEDFTVTQ